MNHPHSNLTAEDIAILQRLRSPFGAYQAMRHDRGPDNATMLELAMGSREIGRATLAPVTLATIGLSPDEMRRIASELADDACVRRVEAVTMANQVWLAFKARASDVEYIDYCAHGLDADTTACEDCQQERAELSEVPAEWFAGGFAENH